MNNLNELKPPRTWTPGSVYGTLIVLGIVMLALLLTIFSIVGCTFVGFLVFLAIVGSTVKVWYKTVAEGYQADILINQFTGYQRALFPGSSLVSPFEKIYKKGVDLKTFIEEVSKGETYTTLNGRMFSKYTFSIRPDYKGGGQIASENLIRFIGFTRDTLITGARLVFSKAYSNYYATKKNEELLDKDKIDQEVWSTDPAESNLEHFRQKHGSIVGIGLEDSDYDEATQKARNTLSEATSIGAAAKVLETMGYQPAEAQKIAKMLNIPGVREYIIAGDIKGLESLTHFSIVPPTGGSTK